MNSLDSQITALYTLAHELLYLGSDGSPIYSDHFSRLNGDVLSRANTLYPPSWLHRRGRSPFVPFASDGL